MEVYFALNTVNGKAYVGWTKHTAAKRFKQHCKEARGRCRLYFHKAIAKYGTDAFSVLTVWKGDDAEEMKQVEKNYIAGMRTNDPQRGYNLTSGGEGTPEHQVSDDVRAFRSNFATENNPMRDPEHRQRVSEALKGHKHSDVTRQRIGDKARNRFTDPGARAKLSAARLMTLDFESILRMYLEGMSCKAIGDKLNINDGTVSRRLKAANVPMRNASGRAEMRWKFQRETETLHNAA
jgi:group I intron endonuclease